MAIAADLWRDPDYGVRSCVAIAALT